MPILTRRRALSLAGLTLASTGIPVQARALLTPVRFVTNWLAQSEHGGFYQAKATGIYEDYGLDVSIQMGGTGVNILQLLAGRAVDFAMGSSLDALYALSAGIPLVTVAAYFQKDPQCLLVDPDSGLHTLADLQNHPIYISPGANLSFWPFLQSKYGFSETQKRPYVGSLTPFLRDPTSAQQGYITAEIFRYQQATGRDPGVIWLTYYGYNPYVTTIETRQDLIRQDPDLVRRFVQASTAGWQSYLQDPEPAHKLIRQANPEMSEGLLQFGYEQMRRFKILGEDPGQIGQMTDPRWQSIFESAVAAGMFPPTLDYRQAYTLDFLG